MNFRGITRSLRWRMFAFATGVSVAFVAGTWAVQRTVVQPEFAAIEEREAATNLERVAAAIARDGDALSRSAQDYAAWDDALDYVTTRDPAFARSNLVPDTLENLGIDAMFFFDRRGDLVWGMRRDAETGVLVADAGLTALVADPYLGLLQHARASSRKSGVFARGGRAVIAASAAITNSAQDEIPSGSVVVLRLINDAAIAALSAQVRVPLALTVLGTPESVSSGATEHLAEGRPYWSDTSNPETLIAYSTISDARGDPKLLLRIELRRETSRRAAEAANIATAIAALGGAALLFGMRRVLTRLVVSPLELLAAHARQVGQSGDLHARIGLSSHDEIGVLAGEFDSMVARLERSQAELVEVARGAGRAEIARAVLHDIGNVLTTVTVSTELLNDRCDRSELASLRPAVDLLLQNAGRLTEYVASDPRGQHLLPFLEALSGQLEEDHGRTASDLKSLRDAVDHIAAVVRDQNRNARAKPLLERLAPNAVAQQAVMLFNESLERHRISLERHFEASDPVLIDRHRCIQILLNLLSNAKYAVLDSRGEPRSIALGVRRVRDESGDWVEFVVRDDGVGIAAEGLDRIFGLGHTTREDGQGIGLHSAANLARELGGSMRVESAGLGCGATFTLRVPALEART